MSSFCEGCNQAWRYCSEAKNEYSNLLDSFNPFQANVPFYTSLKRVKKWVKITIKLGPIMRSVHKMVKYTVKFLMYVLPILGH